MYPVVDTVKKGGRKQSWCNRRSVNGVVFFKKGALISLRVLKLRDVWTYAAGARWTCCVGKQTFPSHPDGLSRSPSRQFHVWKGLSQRNQFVRRPSNQGDFTESLLATLIASSSVTWYVCYLSMAAGKVKVPLLLPKIFIADRMKRKCLGNLPMAHPASLLHKKKYPPSALWLFESEKPWRNRTICMPDYRESLKLLSLFSSRNKFEKKNIYIKELISFENRYLYTALESDSIPV